MRHAKDNGSAIVLPILLFFVFQIHLWKKSNPKFLDLDHNAPARTVCVGFHPRPRYDIFYLPNLVGLRQPRSTCCYWASSAGETRAFWLKPLFVVRTQNSGKFSLVHWSSPAMDPRPGANLRRFPILDTIRLF